MLKYSIWGLTSAGIVFGWGELSSGLPGKTALDPSVKAGTCQLPPITRGWDLKLVLLWHSPGHQDDSLSSFPVSPAFCHVAPSSSLAWSKEPPSELFSSLWFKGGVLSSQHWAPLGGSGSAPIQTLTPWEWPVFVEHETDLSGGSSLIWADVPAPGCAYPYLFLPHIGSPWRSQHIIPD